MIRRFQSRSINQTLVNMTMIISTIALMIAIVIFIFSDLITTRQSFKDEFLNLARVTEIHCRQFLSANDSESIDKYLQTLKTNSNLKHALVLSSNKQIIASYPHDYQKNNIPNSSLIQFEKLLSNAIAPQQSAQGIYRYRGKSLYFIKPVFFKGNHVGWIFLIGNMQNFYQVLKADVFISLFTLILCLGIVFVLSKILLVRISAPISSLAKVMNQISYNKNYNLRLENLQKDETGTLTKGFNELLAQIQDQDRDLKLTQYAIEHMSDMVIWTNRNGEILYANTAACRKLKYRFEELSQMNLLEINSETTQEKFEQMWNDIGTDEPDCIESFLKTKSENIFPVEITLRRVDLEGESYHCFFARDISELRQMEKQMQQSQDMKAIGHLTARAAHDLNNVLGGLISYPELLLMEIPEDSHLRDTIQTIQKSGQKAADIVQDLLILARRDTVTPKPIHLNRVIAEVLNSIEFSERCLPYPNVEIIKDLDENLQNITASNIYLTKIIMNLMENAFEDMPNGGQIQIKTEIRNIENHIDGYEKIEAGAYAILSLSNTGVGISEEDLQKIFEPFYTKKVMGRNGTGLGMTVVWALVKEHHGYINVINNQRGSTCFELYFPVAHTDQTTLTEQFSADDYMSTKNRA